ncbi:hypothetical protein L6164_016409 [Bauhinia variegata]|uniref:Uncharacterized protein n=1 Tax=Bauhinia variegata TaxID=167791 RepID=A0ACB9NPG2_BAUVA|nr:hypothetical protein L6164_016409 [Bauhinia variegata]
MRSVGSFNDWTHDSSSYSNLAYFAPPFSVDRSPPMDASIPYADLAVADANSSNHSPVHSSAYGYGYFSNPVRQSDSSPFNAYGYSFAQLPVPPCPGFNSLAAAAAYNKDYLASDQSYYTSSLIRNGSSSVPHNAWSPSAGYTTVHGLSDYAKNSSEIPCSAQKGGSLSQFAEFNRGKSKQVEPEESFWPIEAPPFTEGNPVNQGCRDVKGSNNREHSTNMMGRGKESVPIVADQLEDKSVPVDSFMQGFPLWSLETLYGSSPKLSFDLNDDGGVADGEEYFILKGGAPRFQNPHVSLTGLNSVTKDCSNPAIDSPCYKGAPAEASQDIRKLLELLNCSNRVIYSSCCKEASEARTEEYFGSESNTGNYVKMSSENAKDNQIQNEDPSTDGNFGSEECNSDDGSEECNLDDAVDAAYSPSENSEVSTPNMNVHMLIDTMHNLSELLLFHACELKVRDHIVLKNVITNLNTCIFKNDEQVIPVQECSFPQPHTTKCTRESPEVQQNASSKRPQSSKAGPECADVETESPFVEEVNRHFMFSKHLKLADLFPVKNDEEMMKEDNMIKALKRILCENMDGEEGAESQTLLYKNLWLEAEAALCFTNYKARYDQMKIEMDKYSYKQRDNAFGIEEPSKPEVLPTKQNSATEVNTQDWPVLDAANAKELSGFKFSPDLNKPNTLEPDEKGSQKPDSFIQDSLVSGPNKRTKEYEASIVARFHFLKSQLGDSSISLTNAEELLSPEASQALDSTDKLASGVTGIKANDFEASVMARFHILKSRAQSSSPKSSEGQLLDGVEFAGSGADCCTIRTASGSENLDEDIDPVVKYLTSSTSEDKSNLKEFDLNEGCLTSSTTEDKPNLKEFDLNESYLTSSNTVDESILEEFDLNDSGRLGNQLPTDYTDSASSDWEHVKEEELVGAEF